MTDRDRIVAQSIAFCWNSPIAVRHGQVTGSLHADIEAALATARRESTEAAAAEMRRQFENPTPQMIAAAWDVMRRKNKPWNSFGPGPGFVEAMQAMSRALMPAERPREDGK